MSIWGNPVLLGGGTSPEPPLPEEYQEVEYMDFTPAYGFPVTIPTSFVVEAKFAADELALNRCVFGYRLTNSSDEAFIIGTNANGEAFLWVKGSGTNGIDDNLRVPYSVGVPTVIRGLVYNRRTSAFIGRYSAVSSYYYGFDGKIYYVKGWDVDGVLSFKFVPCYRKSDSRAGWYDVVAGVFYQAIVAQGGSSVNLGPDVT